MSKFTKLSAAVLIICTILVSQGILAQNAKFQQQSGSEGLVCMEAENFSNLVTPVDTYWDYAYEPEAFSGEASMQTFPEGENKHKVYDEAVMNAPYMEYSINFLSADPVYVWARSCHIDGYDDSVWIGMDDELSSDALSYTTDEQQFSNVWYWLCHPMSDANARIVLNVPSIGDHIFRIYMREPSYKVDKIVLTTDDDYIPDEYDPVGPAETLAEGSGVRQSKIAPRSFSLEQNYPNPFNPATSIQFSIAEEGHTTIQVFSVTGERVAVLMDQNLNAGVHQVNFHSQNLNSGVYFYKIQSGHFTDVKKMTVVK